MNLKPLFIVPIFCIASLFISATGHTVSLKIATDRWPPHEDIFNREAPGFCTEVVRRVLTGMGVEFSITQYPWSRAVDFVFKGKSDALFCALRTEARARFCHYPSESLTTLRYLLFINKKRGRELTFNSYDDLIGKRIGTVRAYAYPTEFSAFIEKHRNYQEVASDKLNFRKLLLGRIDYAIADYQNGMLLIRQMGLTKEVVPIWSQVILDSPLYIIFSKKNVPPEFVERFSKSLKEFKSTETYRKIHEKYYGIKSCCP